MKLIRIKEFIFRIRQTKKLALNLKNNSAYSFYFLESCCMNLRKKRLIWDMKEKVHIKGLINKMNYMYNSHNIALFYFKYCEYCLLYCQ